MATNTILTIPKVITHKKKILPNSPLILVNGNKNEEKESYRQVNFPWWWHFFDQRASYPHWITTKP